jgi:hypothetical protein
MPKFSSKFLESSSSNRPRNTTITHVATDFEIGNAKSRRGLITPFPATIAKGKITSFAKYVMICGITATATKA